jgi:non-ribosomal peptide synthetase-like protein
LHFVNVSMSSSAFRLNECHLGANNYLGNDIWYLAGSRVGDNCLIGTKTMMPLDGPMRENVGLLGSPAFEIPRSVARDKALIDALSKAERRERLSAKTRHNLVTMLLLLASHWAIEFVTIYALALTATAWGSENFLAMAAASCAAVVADLAILTFVDRASFGFRRMQPIVATVYDPAFWAVERYWKLSQNELETMFAGTPFSPLFLRLTGVKIGRRVFNDGCGMSERTLVEIGDGANLNAWGYLQSHSMEEGVFKSDVVRIGAGASVGVGSFVLYGVEMREGSILDADAFLMKGEVVPARTRWRGNPAKMMAKGNHLMMTGLAEVPSLSPAVAVAEVPSIVS